MREEMTERVRQFLQRFRENLDNRNNNLSSHNDAVDFSSPSAPKDGNFDPQTKLALAAPLLPPKTPTNTVQQSAKLRAATMSKKQLAKLDKNKNQTDTHRWSSFMTWSPPIKPKDLPETSAQLSPRKPAPLQAQWSALLFGSVSPNAKPTFPPTPPSSGELQPEQSPHSSAQSSNLSAQRSPYFKAQSSPILSSKKDPISPAVSPTPSAQKDSSSPRISPTNGHSPTLTAKGSPEANEASRSRTLTFGKAGLPKRSLSDGSEIVSLPRALVSTPLSPSLNARSPPSPSTRSLDKSPKLGPLSPTTNPAGMRRRSLPVETPVQTGCEFCDTVRQTTGASDAFCSERCAKKNIGTLKRRDNTQTNLISLVNPEFRKVHSKVRWNYADEVKNMIENGCPVDLCDEVGNTPLCVACQNGHMSLVEYLVGKGAEVNHQNISGCSPMHFSVAYGFDEIAVFLQNHGGNPELLNNEGLTPALWSEARKQAVLKLPIYSSRSNDNSNPKSKDADQSSKENKLLPTTLSESIKPPRQRTVSSSSSTSSETSSSTVSAFTFSSRAASPALLDDATSSVSTSFSSTSVPFTPAMMLNDGNVIPEIVVPTIDFHDMSIHGDVTIVVPPSFSLPPAMDATADIPSFEL